MTNPHLPRNRRMVGTEALQRRMVGTEGRAEKQGTEPAQPSLRIQEDQRYFEKTLTRNT